MSEPIPVLVVDDDFATRLLATEALISAGFAVDEAEDGEDALCQLETSRHEVILLDVNMPGIDGYEVCRRLRASPGGERYSILVMTATDDVEAVELAFGAGATDFMTKPLNLPLLGRRVRFMLRAADAARSARVAAHRLTRAQQLAHLVNWRVDADGTFQWDSDPYAALWPEAPADHVRLDLRELVHPSNADMVKAALAARTEHMLEFRLRLPDGSERFVRQHANIDGEALIGATQDVTLAKIAEAQVQHLAFYDDLTGIPNLMFVSRYLAQSAPPVCAAIAIDFGAVDAELTSAAREMLLRAATARVLERVREEDLHLRLDQIPRHPKEVTGPTVVARMGMNEVCVVTTEVDRARTMIRQIGEAFARPFSIAGQLVTLSPRFGLATHPDLVEDIQDLFDRARDAMQEAESVAPRNVVVFGAVIEERRQRRAWLANELSLDVSAVEQGEPSTLSLAYQLRRGPDGSVLGVRAAPRWAHEDELPIASVETALANRIVRWTIERARVDLRAWNTGAENVQLALQIPYAAVSALYPMLETLDPGTVTIELTGRIGAADRAAAKPLLERLRAGGLRVVRADVALDSPLVELLDQSIDAIRVSCIDLVTLATPVLATLAAISRALSLDVVVVDATTPAQRAILDAFAYVEQSGDEEYVARDVATLFDAPYQGSDTPAFAVTFR